MDHSANRCLSGPCFALDDYRKVSRSNLLNLLNYLVQTAATSKKALQGVVNGCIQIFKSPNKLVLLLRPTDKMCEPVKIGGFDYEIIFAKFQSEDSIRYVGICS